jgi:hypothetical protein
LVVAAADEAQRGGRRLAELEGHLHDEALAVLGPGRGRVLAVTDETVLVQEDLRDGGGRRRRHGSISQGEAAAGGRRRA